MIHYKDHGGSVYPLTEAPVEHTYACELCVIQAKLVREAKIAAYERVAARYRDISTRFYSKEAAEVLNNVSVMCDQWAAEERTVATIKGPKTDGIYITKLVCRYCGNSTGKGHTDSCRLSDPTHNFAAERKEAL